MHLTPVARFRILYDFMSHSTLYITQIFRKTRHHSIISYKYGVVRPLDTHTHKTYTKPANWFITLIMGIIILWVNMLYIISIVMIIDHWSCAVVDHISANSLASFGYTQYNKWCPINVVFTIIYLYVQNIIVVIVRAVPVQLNDSTKEMRKIIIVMHTVRLRVVRVWIRQIIKLCCQLSIYRKS